MSGAISSRTAVFRQIDKDVPQVHHDALEFPDGTFVLLTDLHEGQQATVLQLPAQPKTPAEAKAQKKQVVDIAAHSPFAAPAGCGLAWQLRRSSNADTAFER